DPDVPRAVQRGLAAMRVLHEKGYVQRGPEGGRIRLSFPTDLVASQLEGAEAPFAVAGVRDPSPSTTEWVEDRRPWTILEDRYRGGLDTVARRIVQEGPESSLEGIPIGRFGKLVTVDRHEIERFRAVGGLIREYTRLP